MPRWSEADKLRASVRRDVRRLRGDAYAARTQKLPCAVCLSPAVLMCPSRQHWLCDDCIIQPRCECAPQPAPQAPSPKSPGGGR